MRHNASAWFWFALAITLALCAFLVVPIVLSVLTGLTENAFTGVRSGFTFRWIVEVWTGYGDTVWRSLAIASACLAVTLVVGVPAAYVLATNTSRWARLIEEFIALPIAIPGLAIALGMLQVYGGVRAFRASSAFILAGHVLFSLPFMVRAVAAVLASIDLRRLEEGAASLGASFGRRFFEIIIPNAVPGILAGALTVFTLSVGEFNMTWMLHTPLTKTLPVGLADSYASLRIEISSAYTIIFFVMVIPVIVALQRFARPLRSS